MAQEGRNLKGRCPQLPYEATFNTKAGQWQEIDIPFHTFRAIFRGRAIEDAGPLETANIVQFGFMIKERQAGPFRLDVERIEALKSM